MAMELTHVDGSATEISRLPYSRWSAVIHPMLAQKNRRY